MADLFLQTQITATETQITAVNAAVLFLYANPSESYTLNTGQSSQKVTRANLQDLQNQLDQLLDRRSTLQARCNGATLQLRPNF